MSSSGYIVPAESRVSTSDSGGHRTIVNRLPELASLKAIYPAARTFLDTVPRPPTPGPAQRAYDRLAAAVAQLLNDYPSIGAP